MRSAKLIWASRAFALGMLFDLVQAAPAAAQPRLDPVVEFALGRVGFADDGIVGESLVGGAGRFFLGSRISVGPELTYLRGDRHDHLVLTGNVTVELLRTPAGTRRVISPFLVGGAGLFRTRDRFLRDSFTSDEGAFTAGGGVRAAVGHRWTVGIDARVGWEPHIRVNGVIGVQLGR
jgi:hypothetical protein